MQYGDAAIPCHLEVRIVAMAPFLLAWCITSIFMQRYNIFKRNASKKAKKAENHESQNIPHQYRIEISPIFISFKSRVKPRKTISIGNISYLIANATVLELMII